jgi:hypothetical protein
MSRQVYLMEKVDYTPPEKLTLLPVLHEQQVYIMEQIDYTR